MARLYATTAALALTLLLRAPTAHGEEAGKDPGKPAEPAAVFESERAPLAERSQGDAQALQAQLPQGEQQQLTAGAQSFLALWLPANKAAAQGVVIVLPSAGETADWPQTIGPLRRKLPNAGWHTLSLTFPDPLPAAEQSNLDHNSAPSKPAAVAGEAAADATPAQDGATPAAPSASSEPTTPSETAEQHAQRVLARLQAAIEWAQQQKISNIVLLGHGTGSYWAARYLSEHPSSTIKNLLLVAPELPAQFSPPLSDLLPKLQLAIGDFYYPDQELARAAALQRMQASKRLASQNYIQISMAALPGDPATEQEQLYRRIRGWLTEHSPAAQPTATP